jgi:rfaE bifunctional protein kinase chain/domain
MKEIINLPDFRDLHLLIVGDVMIDRYISGDVKRISPEAPVPVVDQKSYENRAGGAANVALNVLNLGAKATLLSVAGEDEAKLILNEVLEKYSGLNLDIYTCPDRKTTVKTRIMAGNQHLLRVDNEDKHDINATQEKEIIDRFSKLLSTDTINGVILQDYNKGLLTPQVIESIINYCVSKDIPTFIDPKEKNFFAYKGCTFFKPNKKEVMQSVGLRMELADIDKYLRERLTHKVSLITLGKEGLYIHDGTKGTIYPASPRMISDVCGAGDSVISVVSLCYLKGMDLSSIARVANVAGGQVCELPGVVPVNYQNLKTELLRIT